VNLSNNLEWSALFFPSRPAISENARGVSYAELNDRANRIATALTFGREGGSDPVMWV
jgi:non-ribosomal peptide synthetase component E (peptide arylation enzyme)